MLERRLASVLAAFVLLPAGADRPGPDAPPSASASATATAPAVAAQRR